MSGPVPKPPGQRRRRNKAPAAVRLPAEPVKRTKAPTLEGADVLLPSTLEWWRLVWSSPVAAQYLDVDVPALSRLAVLMDRAARGELGERVLGELRLLEDRFGLNPVSRRRLQWELEQAGAENTSASATVSGGDARWLRAVSD